MSESRTIMNFITLDRADAGAKQPERRHEPLLVLYNPDAGGGRMLRRIERALDASPDVAARATVERIHGVSDARAAMARAFGALPVAAGGDGTVGLVARALLGDAPRTRAYETPAPSLGVLPLGTTNALASALGMPSVGAALSALRLGRTSAVDVMRTTHPDAPVALVSISTGFEGRLAERYARWRTRWTRAGAGIAAAGLAAAGAALGRTTSVSLVADGVRLADLDHPVYNAGLYNVRCSALGRIVWPDAVEIDGVAEAVVCSAGAPYWRAMRDGLCTAGPCQDADPRWRRWRTARVECDAPLQVDGEPVVPGAFDVRLEAGALRVVAPLLPGWAMRAARRAA